MSAFGGSGSVGVVIPPRRRRLWGGDRLAGSGDARTGVAEPGDPDRVQVFVEDHVVTPAIAPDAVAQPDCRPHAKRLRRRQHRFQSGVGRKHDDRPVALAGQPWHQLRQHLRLYQRSGGAQGRVGVERDAT